MLQLLQLAGAFVGLGLANAQSLCTLQPMSVVDDYLYARYLETPKVDRSCEFADKDMKAAAHAGHTLRQEVIEGAEPELRRRLYRFMTFEDSRGIRVGITTLYRSDYRQSLACGHNVNSVGNSFHGGTLVHGWGHGKAGDLVILADTRKEQLERNHLVWEDVDRFGKLFGLGRPFKDRDGPHVAPLESHEFVVAARRLAAHELAAKRKRHNLAKRHIKKKRVYVASR